MLENCITRVFDATAAKYGDSAAVCDPEREYSFSALRDGALKVAACLDGNNKAPVGVLCYRRADTLLLFLGVMYTARPYLPLDPELPAEKLQKIIASAGVTEVISTVDERADDIAAAGAVLSVLDTDTLTDRATPRYADPSDLLYIVYTSGSTGTPKGVAKSHRAMADFVNAYNATFGFDCTTVIGNQTPFYFDASAKDIYLTLMLGCRLEILPTPLFTFPVRLVEYMNTRRVNFISWVPSALSVVTRLNTFSEVLPEYLKRVFFVGEVFPIRQLRKWRQALPDVEFVNLYGSSEICGIACFKRVDADPDDADGIPLGRPLCNCDIKLADGEIYVSSAALADGYYNDPERTAESFVTEDGKRWYRTGDIARCDKNGDLVFASRRDFQIKHMGHRIELGEIETAALGVDGIALCCCLYDKKHSRICLYCETSEPSLDDRGILARLKPRLVPYMLPHRVIITTLPKNQNGKIDRALLNSQLNKE